MCPSSDEQKTAQIWTAKGFSYTGWKDNSDRNVFSLLGMVHMFTDLSYLFFMSFTNTVQ